MGVSWLLPVRDGEEWLERCLASVLAESDGADEVILVDDGSTRPVAELLDPHPQVTILRQGPRGIVRALETARAAARHPLLARIDCDDVVLPGRIQAQLAFLEAHPEVGVVGGQAELVGEGGPPGRGMQRYVDHVNGLTDLRASLLVESPLFHPAVLMRAEAVAAVGGYRSGDLPEDYDLWLRLAGAGWGLAAVDRPVVAITDRPGRLTRTDPRYRREAFEALKRDWVDAWLLPRPARVVLWGAGRAGRPWTRHLLARGHTLLAVIDPFQQGGTRHGIPVLPPEALAGLELDLLLVAVGARGGRQLIAEALGSLRPDLRPGVHWWALA